MRTCDVAPVHLRQTTAAAIQPRARGRRRTRPAPAGSGRAPEPTAAAGTTTTVQLSAAWGELGALARGEVAAGADGVCGAAVGSHTRAMLSLQTHNIVDRVECWV